MGFRVLSAAVLKCGQDAGSKCCLGVFQVRFGVLSWMLSRRRRRAGVVEEISKCCSRTCQDARAVLAKNVTLLSAVFAGVTLFNVTLFVSFSVSIFLCLRARVCGYV